MRLYDVTLTQAQDAARSIGVRFEGSDTSNSRGARCTGVLRADLTPNPYPRISRPMYGKSRRMPHCVCWHGHRDFMRALFKVNPDARIASGSADYQGSADFETSYRESGTRNIGSQMEPMWFASACSCPDSGKAE